MLQSPSDNENKLNIQSSLLVQIRAKETSKGDERNKTFGKSSMYSDQRRMPQCQCLSQHKRVNATVTVRLFSLSEC